MDYTSIKKYGLDHIGVDIDKSYETFDPTTNNHTIFVYLIKDDNVKCPHCSSTDLTNKGTTKISIKHACAIEDNINIVLIRRVYKCGRCNKYFRERNPFSKNKNRTSMNKEIKIIQEFKNLTATFTAVAKKYDVSNTYVMNLFDKKVDISRGEFTQVISFDEVYNRKAANPYCFVIYSPQRNRIIDILDSRHKNKLSSYFSKIPEIERLKVEYVSIDMYEIYRDIGKIYFKRAKICADSFHVIYNLKACFDKIRLKVMRRFQYLKSSRDRYYWFYKKYRELLYKLPGDLSFDSEHIGNYVYMSEKDIVKYMLDIDDELKLAYNLMVEYREFNLTANINNAREKLDELILEFKMSHISEYIPFWKLLENWKEEIINSFNRVNGYRISNGKMERVNRDIKTIFRLAFGSYNFTRLRNRVLYCINNNAPILYNSKKTTNSGKGKPRGQYNKNKKRK